MALYGSPEQRSQQSEYVNRLEYLSKMNQPLSQSEREWRLQSRRWPALLLLCSLGLTATLTLAYLLWALRHVL